MTISADRPYCKSGVRHIESCWRGYPPNEFAIAEAILGSVLRPARAVTNKIDCVVLALNSE